MQEQQAEACGKTIIIGEHAVVYGAKAVAMPIKSHTMQLALTLNQDPRAASQFFMGDKALPDHVCQVVNEASELLGIPKNSLTLRGKSSLPIGAGLGSSATLCVVVLRALAKASGLTLSPVQIAQYANQLEKRFHGNPSGLDTSVVAFEAPIAFRKGEVPEEISVRGRWQFVLVDSGLRASTKAMIDKASPYFKSENSADRMARFETLADAVIKGLATDDAAAVAAAMLESADMLSEAGVNTAELRDIANRAMSYGALAAKMTGAGGGGAVLCLIDPRWTPARVEAFEKQFVGLATFALELKGD